MKFPIAFWLVFFGFLLHQLLQKMLHFSIPFLDSYYDPFAAAVLGLFALRMERKYLWKKKRIKFKWYEVMTIVMVLALISEQLFPYLSNAFTRDWWDYFAFVLGGIYFYFLLNTAEPAN
ncbi:MAG: hypothetical protein AAGG68_21175 [Bacteroidota bacterium]